MKKMFVGVVFVLLAFASGSHVAKGKPQDQEITAKASCTVPKSYGDFKGMSGSVFIFENPTNGSIKTLTCTKDGWAPQIQILRN